ncbi:hypothetical protein [Sulfitobacter sp. JB4-11]|uniref:hypothetical protein n=1 Tax=Sulfitobacter rhodophyticola TaxID=3238304 RepID=UPI003D8183AA
MLMRSLVFCVALFFGHGLPAQAQSTMTAEQFDAYTLGKTLFYGRNGSAYGVELYLENRRVRWSFLDGQCKDGIWYEDNGLICFVYEDNPDPQCWSFELGAGGLIARFENNPETTELYEAQDTDEEMICLGPKIGV